MKTSIFKLAIAAGLLTVGSAMAVPFTTSQATFPNLASATPRYVNAKVSLSALPTNRNVMGLQFLSDGRAVVLTHPSADLGGGAIVAANTEAAVYLVSGISAKGDLSGATYTKIVDQLTGPAPGVIVVNDTIYFMDRTAFYRVNSLAPTGGTSKALNATRMINVPTTDSGFTWNNGTTWHQYMFTPQYFNGRFYAAYSGAIAPGGRQNVPPTSSVAGGVLSWAKDSIYPTNIGNTGFRREAGGLRSCNGMNHDGKGTMLIADNQGSFKPGNPVYMYKVGQPLRTYGMRQGTPANAFHFGNLNNNPPNWAEKLPYQPPVIWIPDAVGQSGSQPLYVDRGYYKGEWLVTDVNAPAIGRLHLDDVDGSGHVQASLHLFTAGIDNPGGTAPGKGMNRMAWSPDSALYVGVIGSRGDWPSATAPGPMTRVSMRDSASFEVLAMRSRKSADGSANGVELFFSQPVDPATAIASNFSLFQIAVVLTANYGCNDSPGKPCWSQVPQITSVALSNDNRKVFLSIATNDSIGASHIGVDDVGNNPAGIWGDTLANGKQDRTLRVTISNNLKSSTGGDLFYGVQHMAWHYQATTRFDPANTDVNLTAIQGPSRETTQYQSAISTRNFPGMLNVRVDLPNAGKFTVGLYSVNGALVAEKKSTPGVMEYNFETQNLSRGVNILRVKQGANVYSRPVSF